MYGYESEIGKEKSIPITKKARKEVVVTKRCD